MKARQAGRCQACGEPIRVGQEIGKHGSAWVHVECREALVARQRTLEGESFRGTSPAYRRKIKRE